MDADRAAGQIVEAVRSRRPELTITSTARLATITQALLPNVIADLVKLNARFYLGCQINLITRLTLVGTADRLSLLLCSRELPIEQRSYTMASGITFRQTEPFDYSVA
jgi:hypothetical protein